MGGLVNSIVEIASFGLIDDVTGVDAAKDAALQAGELQATAAEQGIAEQRRQFDLTQESLRPFQKAGVSALEQQQALVGLGGQDAQQQAFAGLTQSPGQQFLQERAQKNLLRNSAAIGGLGGGNVREALVQQGVGFAQQDLQNQFGRLGQIAGQGQSAATNVGQLGQQTAGNIANLGQQSAQARASGILGAGQAKSQFTGQLLGGAAQLGGAFLGSDKKLKKNIEKVGEANGNNWYTWTWNDLANAIGYHGDDNGVIANEILDTKPWLVAIKDGYLAVNYSGLGA